MFAITSVKEANKIVKKKKRERDKYLKTMTLCAGTGCCASGCLAVLEALQKGLKDNNLDGKIKIKTTVTAYRFFM